MLHDIFTSQRQLINYFFEHLDVAMAEKVLAEFLGCRGVIVFTGVGKSGIIAEKLSKTMISTGTRALYLPPADAFHGDMGALTPEDLVVIISKSGKSDEVINFATLLKKRGIRSIAWVSMHHTPLLHLCDLIIYLPLEREICPFDLAPTTSTAVQLIYGDVLAVALMKAKRFSLDQYALNHPGGAIGKLIAERVEDVMIRGEDLPVCKKEDLLKETLIILSRKRCGCLLIVNEEGKIEGIFTDGDLRRALEQKGENLLSRTMGELMVAPFLYTHPSTLAVKALELMEGERKVMMLPVIENEKLVGLVHVHNILDKQFSTSSKESSNSLGK